jgi:hypothetical protein
MFQQGSANFNSRVKIRIIFLGPSVYVSCNRYNTCSFHEDGFQYLLYKEKYDPLNLTQGLTIILNIVSWQKKLSLTSCSCIKYFLKFLLYTCTYKEMLPSGGTNYDPNAKIRTFLRGFIPNTLAIASIIL